VIYGLSAAVFFRVDIFAHKVDFILLGLKVLNS
jgi:hypothetical protein